MSISNYERVGRSLNLLLDGLYPFVEREMKASYGDRWLQEAAQCLPEYNQYNNPAEVLQQDVSALLIVIWERWNEVFKTILGRAERTLVSELRETRNKWAHTNTFSTDDAYRALDSVNRLLSAISAPQAAEVDKQKQELLRIRFEEQARNITRRTTTTPTEGQPMAGLKPWREIATPHPDVASGRFQQAEFAADLWQVYLDEGSDEYRNPSEFYRRTYITEGLKQLLANALRRLSGQGGDPVIELQTNFGGGKTHAMLALYHLCHARSSADLPGMEPIFQEVGLTTPPQNVSVAVLVGNKLQPSGIVPYRPEHQRQNRPLIKTLWGELAWQLGGAEGYELVRPADETSTNPGDALKVLFNRFSPCLILIDEWVSYARQLHEHSDLAGGSFDTQFTFAQTLSESAKNAKDTLLVVSIPSSDIEIGGDRGKEALERLKNAIGRVESPWRPASAEESFEIVRRRLFQPITDPNLFVQRDAVVKAFMDMYRHQSQEFPSECKEPDYERRLKAAYPIHPELFDRLYADWSTLDKFQRTRGVLRLMAKVIHCLWAREDRSLMILPAHVPMDDQQVQAELTRYLEDNWLPVIDKDVDGANSLPLTLDRQNSNLGRYSACRRVARTIYMGSAPTLRAANRGIDDRRIKLGCVQPGETPATFGDALRYLTDRATYLYVDESKRYWISTQPNVNRTAQERAEQILSDRDPVWAEVIRRLKNNQNRGEFSAVHVAPDSTADIPDDCTQGVRLVVLHPQHAHSKGNPDSPARQWVEDALNHRGNSPRYYKNTLLFLAADKTKLENLERNTAQYLAWKGIVDEKEILNLDTFQTKQAETKLKQFDNDVTTLLNETYQWLLVPQQPDPQGKIEWRETRLQGQASPIVQASDKAVHEGDLLPNYSATNLRLEALDKYLWRQSDHIDLKQTWECLTRYLYLPRLKNQEVLLKAVRSGVASTVWADNFAYAEGVDDQTGKYLGLQVGTGINPSISPQSLLVKPEVAQEQLNRERRENPEERKETADGSSVSFTPHAAPLTPPSSTPILRRFYGNVELDPKRLNRDVATIASEVVQHLIALDGTVKVTLEIEAEIPRGIPEEVVRTVMENCKTLKFKNQSFEQS
ncbi:MULTISPECIES: Swt1 family HEPN domain-containing protein [unclassified Thermosynechococcus]|uniref:Swt1 family HEPN domain-containing protein n=1 Tax=unclassified Thermosynechococcus TaxID=2622553 RepID=UPI00267414B8|nr:MULTISPECIES: Swt1 family HEPN domain-containing protein [unclassified Thermosynechococcus]MDR7897417.1 Swt1 family HEPN domain-containing protein [Thermosynechococcus sp. JY1332]WKT87047.1 Swt1 family HEPN domain-containing protein [Thermosynechococcus sp. JY1339]WNC52585.1 Swt1 family HEPN domain-containing protein [Thermosynechococcus sp. TG215]WNC55990.1 Swt1 family HEPN domain-containing protein [Thermosynechococcus sp. JY1331]WNC57673.1 Swt1 family HEPN domain-containing protein [Ther